MSSSPTGAAPTGGRLGQTTRRPLFARVDGRRSASGPRFSPVLVTEWGVGSTIRMFAGCDVGRPVSFRGGRMPIDEDRVQELVGQLAGHMTGAVLCIAVWLGDEVGYYRALAAGGAMAADDLAGATGCNPRLTREWLDGQASAGLVSFDATGDRSSMSGEVAALLADESTPTFM